MGEEEPPEVDVEEESEGETDSASTRYWLTNDIAAGVLVATTCLLMLASLADWYSPPEMVQTAYVAGFIVACVWLFGKGAARFVFSK